MITSLAYDLLCQAGQNYFKDTLLAQSKMQYYVIHQLAYLLKVVLSTTTRALYVLSLLNRAHYKELIQKIHKTYAVLMLQSMQKKIDTRYCIYMFTSNNDFPKLLVCIYSLLRHLDSIPMIYVCDDGTLPADVQKMIKKIKYVRLFNSSALRKKFLSTYANKSVRDAYNTNVFDKKILNLSIMPLKTIRVLVLDSDVLFFKMPKDLISFLTAKQENFCTHINDIQNAYILSQKELKNIFNISCKSRINSGCLIVPTSLLDTQFITYYYSQLTLLKKNIEHRWTEQTAFALMCSQLPLYTLSQQYNMSLGSTPPNAICRHYTGLCEDIYFYDLCNDMYEKN